MDLIWVGSCLKDNVSEARWLLCNRSNMDALNGVRSRGGITVCVENNGNV
jgi:hypothetical protein